MLKEDDSQLMLIFLSTFVEEEFLLNLKVKFWQSFTLGLNCSSDLKRKV